MIGTIKAQYPTWLKAKPSAQAVELADHEKVEVPPGAIIPVRWISDDVVKNHRMIDFEEKHAGKHNWFVYLPHWDVVEIEHPKLDEFPLEPLRGKGKEILMPGLGRRWTGDAIDGCEHFTWGEAIHQGTRIPNSNDILGGLTPEKVTGNLILVFTHLQTIRNRFGRPITVTSGYRPPSINRAVGGARNSRHMYGDSVDFTVQGIHPHDVFKDLDPWWGHRGGLASSSVFVHADCRGFKARWQYGY
jgi:hypothetical protein